MYLYDLKTVVTQALRLTFNANYPVVDFANLHIDIEYPDDQQDYPGIWVNYEPVGNLTRGGIDQFGYTQNSDGTFSPYDIWRFQGYVTYTIGALTSLQRDRLFDELVNIFAFSKLLQASYPFRNYIETANPYLAMNMDFDDIAMRGVAETPGTPWGTEEIIYETTIAMEVIGEFRPTQPTIPTEPLGEVIVQYEVSSNDPFSQDSVPNTKITVTENT